MNKSAKISKSELARRRKQSARDRSVASWHSYTHTETLKKGKSALSFDDEVAVRATSLVSDSKKFEPTIKITVKDSYVKFVSIGEPLVVKWTGPSFIKRTIAAAGGTTLMKGDTFAVNGKQLGTGCGHVTTNAACLVEWGYKVHIQIV